MNFFFYFFISGLILSTFVMLLKKNLVLSVFALVLCFINAAGLFILLKAEVLAMILVIVYVGAIAVLFLFITMMIDYDTNDSKLVLHHPIVALFLASVFFLEVYLHACTFKVTLSPGVSLSISFSDLSLEMFSDYLLELELVGVLLLLAMVVVISLNTGRKTKTKEIKQQDSIEQVMLTCDRLKIVKVKSGDGVKF